MISTMPLIPSVNAAQHNLLTIISGSCQAVPLKFLHAQLTYLGDSLDNESGSSGLKSPLASRPSSFPGIGVPSEALVRWHMRLEYFAYETLQDLRIGKLFEIIVDYPERLVIVHYMMLLGIEYPNIFSNL